MGSLVATGLNMLRGAMSKNESTIINSAGGSLEKMTTGLDQPVNQGTAQMTHLVGSVGKSMVSLVRSDAVAMAKGEPMGANARIAMKGEIEKAGQLKEDLVLRQKRFTAVSATAVQAVKTSEAGVKAVTDTVKAQASFATKTAGMLEATAESTVEAKRAVGRLTGRTKLAGAFA